MKEFDPETIAQRIAAAEPLIGLGFMVYRRLPANGQRNVRRAIAIALAGGTTFALLRHQYRTNEAFRAKVDGMAAKGNALAMTVAGKTMGFTARVTLTATAAHHAWKGYDPDKLAAIIASLHGDNDGGRHAEADIQG